MNACEMTNVQIADYILSLQSDVDGFPFSSNEIIREAAKRLLTAGDDDISKDAEIAELRECLHEACDAVCSGGLVGCKGTFAYGSKCCLLTECEYHKWRKALKGVDDEN